MTTSNESNLMDRSSIIGPFPLPEIDDELRARARAASSKWLVFEDPGTPVDKPLPRSAVQGGYEIDANGELTGRYKINPLYRPSRQVAGMDLNVVEVVLWRALHGYNPVGYLADTLYQAEFIAFAEHAGDQRLQVARSTDGLPLFQVFTSDRFVPREWSRTRDVLGWTIYETMASTTVFLDVNPGTSLALRMMVRDLDLLINDRTRQSKELGPIRRDRFE